MEIVANSNSCPNISFFYLIDCIFAMESTQWRKLYEEIQYFNSVTLCYAGLSVFTTTSTKVSSEYQTSILDFTWFQSNTFTPF